MTDIPLLRELPENTRGRDFVVGDIHGQFPLLESALAERGFDPATDRLIAVGDLIDRGPQSPRALEFLAQPWFFSVRGNHEQAMLEWLEPLLSGATPVEVRDAAARHVAIGGDWILPLLTSFLHGAHDDARRWRDALAALPLAISVPRREQRIGVVHATVPGGDWDFFYTPLDARRAQLTMWSRRPLDDAPENSHGVRGIDHVFAGHNRVPAPRRIGNFHMIETAAWAGNVLTLADVDSWFAPPAKKKSLFARWLGRQ